MSEGFRTRAEQSGDLNRLDSNITRLPAGHLQLHPAVILSLALRDIHNIGDVIRFAQSPDAVGYDHTEAITSALSRLFACVENGKASWMAFWRSCGDQPYHRYYHLCATCEELERLSDATLAMPVTRETFGNAGAVLARAGIVTIRDLRHRLRDGIEDVPGLGHKKVDNFFVRLAGFVSAIDADGNISSGFSSGDQKSRAGVRFDGKLELTSLAASMSVGILRLGGKERRLREQEIETLGDLADIWPLKYPNPYGLGSGSIRKLNANLAALQSASSEDEGISWDVYAEATGADLIPSVAPPGSAKEFLRNLPGILSETAHVLADPVLADILLNRLAKGPKEQKTLEQIASEAVPRVTRERIRQKEKKLLVQIAGGLIWDEYGGLNLIFRAEFSDWWKRAAQHFEGQEEIGFESFVSGLASVWNADIADITLQLPIILAIVTGEVQMPSKFKVPNRLDSFYYGDFPDSTSQLLLTKLRLDKTASLLAEYGYETLGDVCEGCLSGDLFSECPNPAKRVVDHLNLIRGAIDDSGSMNWQAYADLQKLAVLPSQRRSTANNFAGHLIADLSELIAHLNMPGRAGDIFRLRTSLPPKTRKTLQGAADVLETFGPTIKREEGILLQNLNDVLIDRDYSGLKFWLDDSFLFYWKEAEAAYLLAENNYLVFSDLISDCWSLTHEEADAAAPSLWAVINGYPNGRPAGKRGKKRKEVLSQTAEPTPSGRIRLTGFRRVH